MPSLEAAYPWLLALVGTSLFTGFGQARRLIGGAARRGHRLRLGVAIAAASTLVGGAAFGGAAIANEISLRDDERPANASRFGPIDVRGDAEPPACHDALVAGPTARLSARLIGSIDGRQSGTVDLVGQRRGFDFRWLAYVATNRELGQYGQARIGSEAWTRTPARGWLPTQVEAVTDSTLDLEATRQALTYGARATAEDRGVEVIERARARRCRVAVDGPVFRATFPQVSLAGRRRRPRALARPARLLGLPRWRARPGRRLVNGEAAGIVRNGDPGHGRGPADGHRSWPGHRHLSSGADDIRRRASGRSGKRDRLARMFARRGGAAGATLRGSARPTSRDGSGCPSRTVYRDLRAIEDELGVAGLVRGRPVGRRRRGTSCRPSS